MLINEYFILYIFFIDATHLIRPNSCLCVSCYETIKKRDSTNNYTKRACIIMACEQIACHIFNSKLIDTLKSTILINKVCKILYVSSYTFQFTKKK